MAGAHRLFIGPRQFTFREPASSLFLCAPISSPIGKGPRGCSVGPDISRHVHEYVSRPVCAEMGEASLMGEGGRGERAHLRALRSTRGSLIMRRCVPRAGGGCGTGSLATAFRAAAFWAPCFQLRLRWRESFVLLSRGARTRLVKVEELYRGLCLMECFASTSCRACVTPRGLKKR